METLTKGMHIDLQQSAIDGGVIDFAFIFKLPISWPFKFFNDNENYTQNSNCKIYKTEITPLSKIYVTFL